ncbi:MAG: hypothetical protein ACM359_15810 [Bacillota bacterium]
MNTTNEGAETASWAFLVEHYGGCGGGVEAGTLRGNPPLRSGAKRARRDLSGEGRSTTLN